MPYSPTVWLEKQTQVGPNNLNKLENGLQAAAAVADVAIPLAQKAAANGVAPLDANGRLLAAQQAAVVGARVYHNANQSVANLTAVPLAFNSERFDTDAIHDLVTNNSRLTCKTAGIYLINGHVLFANNVTGNRIAWINLNGTTSIGRQAVPAVTGADGTDLSFSAVYPLAVNDYVELVAYQTSGVALNVLVIGNWTPEFSMVRLGA